MDKGKKRMNYAFNTGRSSAKWDDHTHLQFIELIEQEIHKGNRPGSFINKDGWKNLVKTFNEITWRCYDNKQLKNHWDSMKKEWTLFKQMIRGESGLGWDETKKTVMADNAWWEQKIKENENYRKFRNKKLSIIWFRYDALFSDIAVTGERARAPSQYEPPTQLSSTDKDDDEIENTEDINNLGDPFATDEGPNDAVTGDDLFVEPTWQQERPSTTKKARKEKMSSAAMLRTNIEDLMQLYSKSTNTSNSVVGPDAESIQKCLEVLQRLPIQVGCRLWNYACTLFTKPPNRTVFINQPSDEARFAWLDYLHQLFEDHRPPP
ncbi:L10-interacting MYB domain-containing protein-like [Diospyros lotus]|uniref:L10-interacting MYB domain-containing protein-like n=1 Tax=Diospyros lotus TaxID=55363 RepID=UPI00225BB921|nr:L10-interacting MYB domain-containing protein-like [Diospyros lotus]XP_052174290.1 L10-interacting MYB domain-containing protein-like [Diospyros lotus]XP_052174291.1 L10-interacting MYB domain-containing protein-like [Diospyros lotus]XP_052174292.1 L10-interacting MYB domain-containing protein-like [Diospyros lotus]